MIQIGGTDAWLRVAVEPMHYIIIGVYISRHRNNILVAESFLKSLFRLYGKNISFILMVDHGIQKLATRSD